MTTGMLDYIWVQTDMHEAARVAGTYVEVKDQFFQHHHFLVLPSAAKNTVFLPDLDFTNIFHHNKASYHPSDYDSEMLLSIQLQLKKYNHKNNIDYHEIQNAIDAIKNNLESALSILFPTLFPKIKSITIIPTAFGTEGSFDFKKDNDYYHLFIWIRTTGVSLEEIMCHFVHCMVSAFVLTQHKVGDTKTEAWKQREAIVDFLLEFTALSTIWKKVTKTIPVLESTQKPQSIVDDSNTYLKKLKLAITPPVITKNDELFSIDGISIQKLSEKEYRLLTILFSNKNTFVGKEHLFNALYSEDQGSDWSLSKLIERLRTKIKQSGVTYPILLTSRKQGYKLVTS